MKPFSDVVLHGNQKYGLCYCFEQLCSVTHVTVLLHCVTLEKFYSGPQFICGICIIQSRLRELFVARVKRYNPVK